VPLPTPNAPESPESLPECISTKKMRTTAKNTCSTEKIVSTRPEYRFGAANGGKLGAGVMSGVQKTHRIGYESATLPPSHSLRCRSVRFAHPMDIELLKICWPDYESFTDSWLAADKNPGGRTRDCGRAAPTTTRDAPEMIEYSLCSL
jgi:hypothetical protein